MQQGRTVGAGGCGLRPGAAPSAALWQGGPGRCGRSSAQRAADLKTGPAAVEPTRLPPRRGRTVHFFASAEKAKRELGWRPAHDFLGDVDALVKEYQASGRAAKEVDFSVDDKILKAVAA